MHKWEEWINEAKYTASNDTFDVGRTWLRAIRNHSLGTETCGSGKKYKNCCGK